MDRPIWHKTAGYSSLGIAPEAVVERGNLIDKTAQEAVAVLDQVTKVDHGGSNLLRTFTNPERIFLILCPRTAAAPHMWIKNRDTVQVVPTTACVKGREHISDRGGEAVGQITWQEIATFRLIGRCRFQKFQ